MFIGKAQRGVGLLIGGKFGIHRQARKGAKAGQAPIFAQLDSISQRGYNLKCKNAPFDRMHPGNDFRQLGEQKERRAEARAAEDCLLGDSNRALGCASEALIA
jgi:hypothetical protein